MGGACASKKEVEQYTGPRNQKILIIGNPFVGKTSLLKKFDDGSFSSETNVTIGGEFVVKDLTVEGHDCVLQIFDTAGQEKFRTMTATYYRDANGVILVFDYSDKKSLDSVAKWKEQIDMYVLEEIPVILVGNKTDLPPEISREAAEQAAENYNMFLVNTSAKEDERVDQPFVELSKRILMKPSDRG